MRRRHRRRFWKKQGNYWFCYLGNRKWWTPSTKGRIYYYNKRDGSFFSPAPKNGGGLKGLKKWWKGYRKKKHGK